MEIRKYIEEDVERVLEIWFESSSIAHDFLGLDQLKEQKNLIRDTYLPMAETWVVEEDGEIQGFISLLDHYVGGLFLHPDQQGLGIGRRLIEKAFQEKGFLTVGVYEKNLAARKFYERMGFLYENEEVQEETGEVVLNLKKGELPL